MYKSTYIIDSTLLDLYGIRKLIFDFNLFVGKGWNRVEMCVVVFKFLNWKVKLIM